MRVLLCHNYYQQRGGEDESFDAEVRLLRSHGHDVALLTRHNREVAQMDKTTLAATAIYSRRSRHQVRDLIASHRPQVLHCTNTFPLISPAIYGVAKAAGIPIVQSLRNFRPLCVNGYLFRDGKPCEECVGRSLAWPGVIHRCYRESTLQSAGVVATQLSHRLLRIWRNTVDIFVTPSEHARSRFVAGGFPADRILVKPNFIEDAREPGNGSGGYAVFAGRLSPEKGLPTLLDAWKRLSRDLQLWIVGDGPLEGLVQQACARDPRVRWLGRRPQPEVVDLMAEATCVVVPSLWYETFGRTIIEAYASGTPAIVSRLGAMAELVEDGRTGYRFEPGNAADLAVQVEKLCGDQQQQAIMRREARQEYERRYTPAANYKRLSGIYARALGRHALELDLQVADSDRASPVPSIESVAGQ